MKESLLALLLVSTLSFAKVGLKLNQDAPSLVLKSTEGELINFSKLKKTSVVVFYRGSWCPICMKQLKEIQSELIPKLPKDTQLIAISVDKMKLAKIMRSKFNFSFTVLSDPRARSLKAFKIVNKVSDEMVKTYKNSYKIDIEADSGEVHHMIAHPAVYIIKEGKIVFADVNTDYTKRTKNRAILRALK